jgi:hypothetical protein
MRQHYVNRFLALAVVMAAGAAGVRAAEEARPADGTLLVGAKTYKLAHSVAYRTKLFDEEAIAVVLSDKAIPVDKLQKSLKEDGSDDSFFLFQPHVKLTFNKAGEIQSANAWADNTSISVSGGGLEGEMKLEKGRVQGKASLELDGEGQLKRSFELKFDVPLLGAASSQPAKPSVADKPAGPVKPSVSGTFKGNGKEAKLAFVSAHWTEPFADKPSFKLVFTEKDHSKDPKPDFKAGFGHYGSALVISLHEDGSIFGCEVSHAAHEKRGFSSIGDIKTGDFKVEDGRVEGELTTDGEQEVFGETWEVKIKFVAPLAAAPADSKPADDKPDDDAPKSSRPKVTIKPRVPQPDKLDPKPAAEQLNVKDLAIPKDATDIEYKTLVEHVGFKSAADVKTLAASLDKSLAAQGWKSDGSDLVTPKSAILKRERGDASLTIFVKPAGTGSQVTMFTEGLSWEGK